VQDAVNLGWKLAQVVNRTSAVSLLDTYHAERHPVAARVLRNTIAQSALLRVDDRIDALRDQLVRTTQGGVAHSLCFFVRSFRPRGRGRALP
jgi:2-polyprenyl-6-methoxyphenol hydroxylase-like FAD-dependent oxidoreductase